MQRKKLLPRNGSTQWAWAGFLVAVALGLPACGGAIEEGDEGDGTRTGGSANSSMPGGGTRPGGGGQASGDPSVPGGSSLIGPGAAGMTPGGSPGSTTPGGFACVAGKGDPTDTGLLRMSDRQYRNTLRDLFVATLGNADAGAKALASLDTVLLELPLDTPKELPQDLRGSYRRLDQEVDQAHADTWYQVGLAAGRYLTAPERIKAVTEGCSDAFTADCLDKFIRKFGARALRRPVEDAELPFYRGFFGATTAVPATAVAPGFADVIAGLLGAPQFLYRVEHGQADGAVADLTAFELASRLSYQLWDSMPDDALWKSAESGALLRDDEYRRQVDRLFADARTQSTLREFYRDWMKLERIAALDGENKMPLFKAFAGINLPTSMLRKNMIDEALEMVEHYTWKSPSGVNALLESDLSFARTKDLADIYGLAAPWTGAGTPPSFRPGERPGLLTRAAFLSTGHANTRPIMKGIFARENILCDDVPSPPGNEAANSPPLSDKLSTRQVVEALTETDGTACAACHKIFINGLGFATENFDSLGRVRAKQKLFATDGKMLAEVPIDTRSIPQVITGDMRPSSGAADVMKFIGESGKAQSCLVRNYFRFSFSRWESLEKDACVLDSMRKALTAGTGSLPGLLKEVVLAPLWKRRAFR